jgi:hypothetical protein
MTIAAALNLPTQTGDQAWITALLALPDDLDTAKRR